jgi:uncharacterized protein (DUF169 family)
LDFYHKCGKEIEDRLRLKTFPIAIKVLETEEDIPQGALRPARDMNTHLSLCQGFAMSRREGTMVAMLKEDMWCFEPVIGYGIEEPPQYFMEGHNRYPRDVDNLEAGANYAGEFPRLETSKYVGVISAAIATTPFEPDVIMLYCDSAQLSLALLAREYKEGLSLPCRLSSHAACMYGVVPAMKDNQCQVTVPCRGDRYTAIASDNEMVLVIPKGKLGLVLEGLRYVAETGSKLPRGYQMKPEWELPGPYKKAGKMLGMAMPQS